MKAEPVLLLESIPLRSHFSFSAVAGACMVFINVIAQLQTLLNFGCIDGFRSLSRIFKFENISGPDPYSKFWSKSGVGECDSDPLRNVL